MSGTQKTIAQFARTHALRNSDVSKMARRDLDVPAGRLRDSNYLLDPSEQRLLMEAFGIEPEPEPGPESEPAPEPEPPLALRVDPMASSGSLRFGPGSRTLLVHPDAFTAVGRQPRFRKRLSLALQQLAAHGRTAMVKSCADPDNRGWFRTPFGGNGGMQYYLWWSRKGLRPVEALGGDAGDVFVRAVRHHDDHAPLDAGGRGDYLPFGPRDVEDESYVEPPWTDEQVRFVEASDPVRFVRGRPGSGKTTVLWKAIEARADQRVLYLTWSIRLTEVADERFAAFAPVGVDVTARSVTGLLGTINGRDVPRIPLTESRRRFFEALGRTNIGGWRGHELGLFAEVRAMLIGRAVPGAPGVQVDGGLARLEAETYIRRRSGAIGRSRACEAADVLDALSADALGEIFAELVAATEAIERLRADMLPNGFEAFDRVVVDEVQDLTLLDAAVVVELCRAIARRRGFAPWLLMAGDDGQTVRPSGFDWGRLGDLVAEGLARARSFQLEENLRSPARIAAVVERASAIYKSLDKSRRPTKQARERGGQHADAFLYHVDARSRDEAITLLEELDEMDEAVLLAPQDEPPAWLPPQLRDAVRTPDQVKGLEYQSVVVLDPGLFLASTRSELRELGHGPSEHAVRTRIDQLRVALSRATETLAFVDVDADKDARARSQRLLGDPVPCDPDDLVEHFTDSDLTPEERVRRRIDEARALLEEVPRRAWRRANQAVQLLGDPRLPNGVADDGIRREAHDTLLATAARLLVEGLPERVTRAEIDGALDATLTALDSVGHGMAIDALYGWLDDAASPVELLDCAFYGREDAAWLRAALIPVHQRLRHQIDALADDPEAAGVLIADVAGWLGVVGFTGDAMAHVRDLRIRGAETLLVGDALDEAEGVIGCIDPPEPRLAARLHEARGRFAEAAAAFEATAAGADALRNWRAAGDWDRAIALTRAAPELVPDAAAGDLPWLVELESLLTRRPPRLDDRLTPAERARLSALLAR